MGRKLVLTGTKLTNLSAPKLATIDQIEAPGSLVLLDPTHPYSQWAAGAPANNALVPNLFGANALTLAGAGGNTGFKVVRGTGLGPAGGSGGLIERSSKGGLHGAPSRTTGTVSLSNFQIQAPDALELYLLAHPTNNFFFSSWGKVTRTSLQPGSSIIHTAVNGTGPATNRLAVAALSGTSPATGRNPTNILGDFIVNQSSNAWLGTRPTDAAGTSFNAFNLVNPSWAFSDAKVRELGGLVHYRFYVEDLTVSGRTYAEADALDNALYTKEVLTAGGRYFGDTFTDPATLA